MKTTSEAARIADQMRAAFDGEAWHGPALLELLADVDAKMAAARPIASAHTIWELSLHIQAWEEAILLRLGGDVSTVSDEKNFPRATNPTDRQWRDAVTGLIKTHEALLAAVTTLPDQRLADKVPGKDYDVYTMLHGSAQHVIYHAGQIVILKRALER